MRCFSVGVPVPPESIGARLSPSSIAGTPSELVAVRAWLKGRVVPKPSASPSFSLDIAKLVRTIATDAVGMVITVTGSTRVANQNGREPLTSMSRGVILSPSRALAGVASPWASLETGQPIVPISLETESAKREPSNTGPPKPCPVARAAVDTSFTGQENVPTRAISPTPDIVSSIDDGVSSPVRLATREPEPRSCGIASRKTQF